MPMEKTFDAKSAEPRVTARWEAKNAFVAGANQSRDDKFCVMLPPPNVTGALHVGHAFNHTLQDILVRWHRMRGFDTLWQPGTDHAGIATQMVTEREMAQRGEPSRAEMGRAAFERRVWQQKTESRENIIGQLKRLGASCDWSREAFTMSGAPSAPAGEEGNFHDAVIKVFIELYNRGLIYRGKRLVNWDPKFETAISDLEVENIETPGHMWHFKYPLANGVTYEYVEKDETGAVTLKETRDYISIATTRPETMLGDGAVAVHLDDARYAPLIGKLCEIPVGPKEHRRLIPIIADPYPDPSFGSGAVKITGAHDFNDYDVAKRNDIPMYRLMDTRGTMRVDGASYADASRTAQSVARGTQKLNENEIDALNLVPDHLRGLDRFEARARVVAEITKEGLAVMTRADDPRLGRKSAPEDPAQPTPLVEAKPIMQPYGDRSKVVIEPMLTDQWFVDTAQIVAPAIDAVRDGRTTIIPESGEKVYFHWLDNIEPWCISRQLWWGHQIPVWYGLELSGEGFADDEGDNALDLVEMTRLLIDQALLRGDERHHCASDFEAATGLFGDVLAQLPMPLSQARVVEVADRSSAVHMLSEALAQYTLSQDPTALIYPIWRDPDVLDTWFSSGLWPIGTLGWPQETPELARYFPTSLLVTGQDILFFWVARMMMVQLAITGQVPFREVYLHGLVRDANGKKMSKSLGNVVDPREVIDEYGADALRFTNTAMASLGGVLKLDKQRIAGYRNFGTKLWNAFRFAEMNAVTGGAQRPAPQHRVNAWIIGETARVREEVDEALAHYRFNDAANALYAHVWGTVCDWYLEFSKPLLQSDDAAMAQETRETLSWVLDQALILLHPIMPFITEELWDESGARDEILALTDWPCYGSELVHSEAESEMRWVISLIEAVRSVRGEMNVPAGDKIPLLCLELDASGQSSWDRNAPLIQRLARIKHLEMTDTAPKGSVTIPVRGGVFVLPLAGIIDPQAEEARLEKALAKVTKELAGLTGRLKNKGFLDSAPEEVVTETRQTRATKEADQARLSAALLRVKELGQ